MEPTLVRDIMITDLVTLQENEDLDLAYAVMQLGRIRHLPVVQGTTLVGLVTHRDILRAQVELGGGGVAERASGHRPQHHRQPDHVPRRDHRDGGDAAG